MFIILSINDKEYFLTTSLFTTLFSQTHAHHLSSLIQLKKEIEGIIIIRLVSSILLATPPIKT